MLLLLLLLFLCRRRLTKCLIGNAKYRACCHTLSVRSLSDEFFSSTHNIPIRSTASLICIDLYFSFEATDPDTDEVVLMKIQRVLLALLDSSQGYLLSDQIINDMVQTCFKMSIQSRLSGTQFNVLFSFFYFHFVGWKLVLY